MEFMKSKSSFLFLLMFSIYFMSSFEMATVVAAENDKASPLARFSSKSCLEDTYEMKMEQKGAFFGLLKKEFVIDKKGCLIHISFKKYLPKEWLVDVCREPIHIKTLKATGMDVSKRNEGCTHFSLNQDKSGYCSLVSEILNVVQDEGLIFAEGDREDIKTDHGKTYCVYLLLRKYLLDATVFSRFTEVPDIFFEKEQSSYPQSRVNNVDGSQDSIESRPLENQRINKESSSMEQNSLPSQEYQKREQKNSATGTF